MANITISEIINMDVLKCDIAKLSEKKTAVSRLKVVANLPYYITTPIIMDMLAKKDFVKSMTVMVQKELLNVCRHCRGKAITELSLLRYSFMPTPI